jgi:hypothetical protein
MSGVTTATIVAIAAVAVSAGGAAYSAYSASEAAGEQADLQEKQAAMEKAAAETEANKIRDRGRRTQGAQEAALAASGVKLDGQGSSSALLSETTRLTESDALAVITGGNNRATLLKGEADISRGKGDAALISGGLNVASSLIGSYAAYQKSNQNSQQASLVRNSASTPTLLGGSGLKIDKAFQ